MTSTSAHTPTDTLTPSVHFPGGWNERLNQRPTTDQEEGTTHGRLPPPRLQLLTQNVQGLAKRDSHLNDWFDSFRRKGNGSLIDVILLQETRATARWTSALASLWARSWGYDPSRTPQQLSFWPATTTAAAGVAILVPPATALDCITPWRADDRSEHFVAIQGTVDNQAVTIINNYRPHDRNTREAFFGTLAAYDKPQGLILLGGDFNCTLDDELDRSYRTTGSHHSSALVHLLSTWGLVDAATPAMLTVRTSADLTHFHTSHHTYAYKLPDGHLATSRLDRWYLTRKEVQRGLTLVTSPPICRSDHKSVSLLLSRDIPVSRPRSRPPALRYPLPPCASDTIDQVGHDLLLEHGARLTQLDAPDSTREWDVLETTVRRACLATKQKG